MHVSFNAYDFQVTNRCQLPSFISGRGGRFETFQHTYSAQKDDSSIFSVVDCISLYPSQSHQLYPVGKYEVISDLKILEKIQFDRSKGEHLLNNEKLCGIAHVSILTPVNTSIPLFGIKIEETYVYGCCTMCIKKKSKKKCTHSDKNRAILATLCWNELNFAVENGYEIRHIFEIYFWVQSWSLFT